MLDTLQIPGSKIKAAARLPKQSDFDVCIVGAGVAGAALAWHLGRYGISVAVVERDLSEPEKIIGELLQPGGVMKLQELGLQEALNGFDAQHIEGYALFMEGAHFKIPYPMKGNSILKGRGFRYGKFIMKLRESIRRLPSVTLIEGSANELLAQKNDGAVKGIRYNVRGETGEKYIHASLTVVCDGGFSKFRADLNGGKKIVKGFMVGLLLKNCQLPYPLHGHVFLDGASPFLSYPVSSVETRMLIDFPGQSPKLNGSAHAFLRETVCRQLPEQMRLAFINAINDGNLKAMPNSLAASKPVRKPGLALLGDSLNMRHPLTGGGMTAALTDVQLLGNKLFSINNFKNATATERAVSDFYNQRHQFNSTINILADALYDVMSHPDLKRACFYYLKKGDNYASAPISILSAVSRDRQLLVRKFFTVAMFAVGETLKPVPTIAKLKDAYDLLRKAVHILSPLLMNERPSRFSKVVIQIGGWIFPHRRFHVSLSNTHDLKTYSYANTIEKS